jgi:hypothetical protein
MIFTEGSLADVAAELDDDTTGDDNSCVSITIQKELKRRTVNSPTIANSITGL